MVRVRTTLIGVFVLSLPVACTGILEEPEGSPKATTKGPPAPSAWWLVAPARPGLPTVSTPSWVRNPIDAFTLAGLDAAGLTPAAEADRRTLLRRASLDARGLPPTPEEIDQFLSDSADGAYERLLDRLLADPAYGEHRAHYWLDVVRYADTNGFELDSYRTIWPYRDYVVGAFNQNIPFDQFTLEQLAGDLLPAPTQDQRIATGFGRNAMTTGIGGGIEEEFAAIAAKDRVETVAATWMGLTLGCAACHNHKFDPISQRDFYRMTAFFRNTTQTVFDYNAVSPPPVLEVGADATPSLVTEERSSQPTAYVLTRGNYASPGELVTAGVPTVLPQLSPQDPANRLGLARWLVSPTNPLTARVVINRFWAELFGVGIVSTPENFGVTGAQPTNQPLLDWLAVELVESGWDLKHMLRLMLSSATYRQAAVHTATGDAKDPENRLLWHGPRFRLDAEVIRDQALAASGLLVKKLGGPPVKPYQPPGLWEAVTIDGSTTAEYVQDSGDSLFRRSLYTFWKRTAPPASLQIFNAPTRESTVPQRERTNTPLQALASMNDPQLLEAARHLAVNALTSAAQTDAERLDYAALRVLGRPLDEFEQQTLSQSLASLLEYYAQHSDQAEQVLTVGDTPVADSVPPATQAAWMLVASALLNTDEAVMK